MSVKRRRQALSLCLDAAVVIVVQMVQQFHFKAFHGLELVQIQQLTFEYGKAVFHNSIVQAVSFAAHALGDFLSQSSFHKLMQKKYSFYFLFWYEKIDFQRYFF